MSSSNPPSDATKGGDGLPTVAIVGGGLAGLAAAVKLADRPFRVELFEAKRRLGGRAGSFLDPNTRELLDNCQHVSMGCCTAFADFCERTEIADQFRRYRALYFFGPDGRRHDVMAARWLPAPLHLWPMLWGMKFLSIGERLSIAATLLRLRGQPQEDSRRSPTIGEWLRKHGQTPRTIERFWSVILVSALSETVDRASVAAARKVFVEGFMASRHAYHLLVPTVPLGTLYRRVEDWLQQRGVKLHLETSVRAVTAVPGKTLASGIVLANGTERSFDNLIMAVPWRKASAVFPDELAAALPELVEARRLEPSSITSVHLWFDRPITRLPHAVFIDRTSQWIFNRGEEVPPSLVGDPNAPRYYYQVVISASRDLRDTPREQIPRTVFNELREIWPAARDANLQHWRVITEPDAVFSPRPGSDAYRPPQTTAIRNVFLAGDWTRTGWPSTMEGAVRSGYLAAEALIK